MVPSPRTVLYLPLMPHAALREEKPESRMALGTLGHSTLGGFGVLFPALPGMMSLFCFPPRTVKVSPDI